MKTNGIIVAALTVGAAVSGCSSKPVFAEAGERLYLCEPEDRFVVRFSADRREAKLSYRGQMFNLTYQGGGLLDETYSGDGAVLSLDPEANLQLPDDQRVGICNDATL